MIVDDNEQNCELLHDVLNNWGYAATMSFQGLEALTLARKNPPDLILLDVMLPGLNGFEICRELKNHPITRHIPVIMQTVLDEPDDRIRGYKVGASIFLSKPLHYGELRQHIERLIQAKRELESKEERIAIIRSLIRIMEKLSPELYQHAEQVSACCIKTANLLVIDAERKERLFIAAWMHNFIRLPAFADEKHGSVGRLALQELRVNEWLDDYLLYGNERIDGSGPYGKKSGDLAEDVWVLIATNQFMQFKAEYPDREQAFLAFQGKCRENHYPRQVIDAMHQVIQDELFLLKKFPGGLNKLP